MLGCFGSRVSFQSCFDLFCDGFAVFGEPRHFVTRQFWRSSWVGVELECLTSTCGEGSFTTNFRESRISIQTPQRICADLLNVGTQERCV